MQYSISSVFLVVLGCATTTPTPPSTPLPITTATGSIKCYVCNSARDPRCGDPFNPRTIELADCGMILGRNATSCRKNVQRVTLGHTTDTRTIRSCGYLPDNLPSSLTPKELEELPPTPSHCYNRAGTFEVMVTYCTCRGEMCNHGNIKTPWQLGFLLVVMAIIL